MTDSSSPILSFHSIPGFSIRASFDGGTLSSDFGALLLSAADRQTGLINRLVQAIDDKRHPSYIDHSMHDLLRQRIFQTACGYADGNDSNTLRNDPLFKMATGRIPLSTGNELASGPTFSRLEASMTRKDIYRLAKSFVQAFIASYSKQPEIIVLDMAYSFIHTIRENTLAHTELAKAQPTTIIQKLFKIALRVRQYKDRINLSLPSSCPVQGLLSRITKLLCLVPLPPAPA